MGHSGHRQLETLHSAGRFPGKRVVINTLRKVPIRLDRMRSVLEDLDRTIGPEATRAVPLVVQGRVQDRKRKHKGV